VRAQNLTLKRARRLRQSLTGAEVGLWVRLRGKALDGYRFRRQHPVGPYILDFYCTEARLAVEIDGESHNAPEQVAHDARRDRWLLEQGIRTLRIGAEAAKNPDAAVLTILEVLRRYAPSVTS
jgi:very-short-patch-repair endonuclease